MARKLREGADVAVGTDRASHVSKPDDGHSPLLQLPGHDATAARKHDRVVTSVPERRREVPHVDLGSAQVIRPGDRVCDAQRSLRARCRAPGQKARRPPYQPVIICSTA